MDFENFDLGGLLNQGLDIYEKVQQARHKGHPKDKPVAQPLATAPGEIPTGVNGPTQVPAMSGMGPMWIGLGLVALVLVVVVARKR